MKIKYAIIFVLVVVLIGAGVGLKMFFKPHADISKLKSEFKVEANGLIGEFEQDENAATTKYSEKVLEITGKLASKNKLQNGTDLLMMEDEMQGISCQLDSSWAATNQATIEALETGSSVTVKGICKGYLMEIKVSPAVVVK
ncbi:MAG: OB-fold putative lipoprotein [Prolixibacteraceae bacterium]|nr:OB-fold putative lipoprotein [Prolixibacteraceae bacterium]